jgi:hypothetical protein
MTDLTFVINTPSRYVATGAHNVYYLTLSDLTPLWILSIWSKTGDRIIYSTWMQTYNDAVALASAIDDPAQPLDSVNVINTAIESVDYIRAWISAKLR